MPKLAPCLVSSLTSVGFPLLACLASVLLADEPLHPRIDEITEAKAGGTLAAQSSDAEFLRRVYLDLAGRIPSVEETQEFLADTGSDKRRVTIDRLLASEEHVRRMTQAFDVMLMERLADDATWKKYLHQSFKVNKPWDQMAREILNPNSEEEALRGAAVWYVKRLENYGQNPVDVPALVRDVGRHFMGIDVQCCQCHDHLFVDEYKQDYYQGIYAFVGQAYIRKDVQYPAIGLKPLEKKVEYMSVFEQKPMAVGPKLPGMEEVALPTYPKGEEFAQPPDNTTKFPGVPKFHTLSILSEQLPRAENSLFTRNIANRLWWLMIGRGLVWPLDLQHADNAPSHPELLDLLAKDLTEHQFDMRRLLREIALSRTYQRSSVAPDEASVEAPLESHFTALEKQLSSEQMLASVRQALGASKPLVIAADDTHWAQWQAKFDMAMANPAREPEVEHSPTVKAALFLMNDETLLGWINPKDDNLAARLMKIESADALADELYLAVLSRQPTDEEKTRAGEYLSVRKDRREQAVANLVWSLLASNEFCANH